MTEKIGTAPVTSTEVQGIAHLYHVLALHAELPAGREVSSELPTLGLIVRKLPGTSESAPLAAPKGLVAKLTAGAPGKAVTPSAELPER